MSFEWKDTTVKDFCPFKYGKGLTERERVSGENLVVSSAGVIGTHSSALVNNKGVVIGRKGTVGNVTFVNKPFWAIDTAFYIEDEPKFRDLYFTYYLLKTLGLNGMNSDSAVPGLNRENAHSIKIKVPDLQTQRLIGSLLKLFDNRIDLLKENNQTLESIAQAIFKSWFVDFDPVHAKQQGKECAGIDKATADLFPNSFVESKLGLIPKDWEVGVLGDLLTPKRGKTITKSACIAGDVPVVAGGLEPAYFHNKSNVKGPVITISASGANAGFVRLYQEDVWASDCTYISSEQTDEIFFWYMFLKYNQEKIYFMQQGAAQPHIYASDLMRLNVCFLKNNALQSIFNTFIAPIFKRIGRANRQIDILSNLRDTLLPRLISGKLDLSNIEEQLEGIA